MKFNPFNYIRYLLEFLIIITGVLLSFYLDDLRQLGEKESYKDTLIEELLVTSQEDLKQIEKIRRQSYEFMGYTEFANKINKRAWVWLTDV